MYALPSCLREWTSSLYFILMCSLPMLLAVISTRTASLKVSTAAKGLVTSGWCFMNQASLARKWCHASAAPRWHLCVVQPCAHDCNSANHLCPFTWWQILHAGASVMNPSAADPLQAWTRSSFSEPLGFGLCPSSTALIKPLSWVSSLYPSLHAVSSHKSPSLLILSSLPEHPQSCMDHGAR